MVPGGETPKGSLLVPEEGGKQDAEKPAALPLLSPGPGVLRNDRVTVRVHPDGRFDLTAEESGRTFTGMNLIVDEQDSGSQYAFAHSRNRAVGTAAAGTCRTILNSGLRAVIRVETVVPCFDERSRTPDLLERRLGNDADAVDCPLAVEIGLDRGSSRVDVAVEIDNRGAGHRLSAVFPAPGQDAAIRVRTPFDFVDRTPARNALRPRGVTQAQMDALKGSGMQGFLAVDDGSDGWVLAARGLYEYRHDRQAGRIALTLLRSVGTITFGFERWGSAEQGWLSGRRRVEYAICPFHGSLFDGVALEETDAFLHPVLCRQYPAGEPVCLAGPALADARLAFSAFKKAENRQTFIFRFGNLSTDAVTATVPLGRRYREIWRCRLDETREEQAGEDTDAVALTVEPKRIVTLELVP
jgi:hypothetical protein